MKQHPATTPKVFLSEPIIGRSIPIHVYNNRLTSVDVRSPFVTFGVLPCSRHHIVVVFSSASNTGLTLDHLDPLESRYCSLPLPMFKEIGDGTHDYVWDDEKIDKNSGFLSLVEIWLIHIQRVKFWTLKMGLVQWTSVPALVRVENFSGFEDQVFHIVAWLLKDWDSKDPFYRMKGCCVDRSYRRYNPLAYSLCQSHQQHHN